MSTVIRDARWNGYFREAQRLGEQEPMQVANSMWLFRTRSVKTERVQFLTKPPPRVTENEAAWPVVKNEVIKYESWYDTHDVLVNMGTCSINADLKHRRIAIIKAIYVLINNKMFYKAIEYQHLIKVVIEKFKDPDVQVPQYVKRLIEQLESLTKEAVARRRWGIFKVFVKLLSLHKIAVITANHPSRIDFTIRDEE